MPKLRMNLRDMSDLDELDLIDEVDHMSLGEERGGDREDRRVINPVALQRRQDSRKFGKEIARFHRQNKGRLKP
ncbi:hypothetical protein K2Z83_23610 [Oscillochloris sp. ZM17-4]|uniref:hypothetical protein n=1 Tax=Oscillochloris sp. ZM17-4 TaxID=2866714 RepID=UPI001C73E0B4|nr:hypothetical protein [Oscillochloris sp. ZM17-4]MBX0330648.1 hypothetical protein [Oscillochloris sp. ZM17-4]